MGVLANAQLWGAEWRVSVRCDLRGEGEEGNKGDREREKEREKERQIWEKQKKTQRLREICKNQRGNRQRIHTGS